MVLSVPCDKGMRECRDKWHDTMRAVIERAAPETVMAALARMISISRACQTVLWTHFSPPKNNYFIKFKKNLCRT